MAGARFTGFNEDWSWHQRSQECIAQGSLTNSKRPDSHIFGIYPTHIAGGLGPRVWTPEPDKRILIDFICGLGTNILGYGDARVGREVAAAASGPFCPSLPMTIEVEAAELFKSCFPFVDLVKFLKTGTEACMGAIRIARAKTGRSRVLTQGYHGWSDEFVSLTPPGLGVLEHKNISKLQEDYGISEIAKAAAVILEPVELDYSPKRREWLQRLRKDCTDNGTVLIFDEIITGFRTPLYSVSRQWGIVPDLICIGKSMANGLPIAAIGGKKDIMNCCEYYTSSTYAGEVLSLVAAKEVMRLVLTKKDPQTLWDKGALFMESFNEAFNGMIHIKGYPTRGRIFGNEIFKGMFFQEALRAGLLFGPSVFLSHSHGSVMDSSLNTIRDIARKMQTGSVKLEGKLPRSPFANLVRGDK